jgi:hypothetical protein
MIIDCFLLVSFKGGEKKQVGETVVVGPYIVYPSDNELLSLTMCLTVSPFAFFSLPASKAQETKMLGLIFFYIKKIGNVKTNCSNNYLNYSSHHMEKTEC